MKDQYDPEFDSPEARASFATRHICIPHERKTIRDRLLAEYRTESVVDMFPGKERHWGRRMLPVEELKQGGVNIYTVEDAADSKAFGKIKRLTAENPWETLLSGEWSQTPYHQGRHQFHFRCTPDERYWAILSTGFPNRIVAAAECQWPIAAERITATMLRRLRELGGDYVDIVWLSGDFELDVFWEIYWEEK